MCAASDCFGSSALDLFYKRWDCTIVFFIFHAVIATEICCCCYYCCWIVCTKGNTDNWDPQRAFETGGDYVGQRDRVCKNRGSLPDPRFAESPHLSACIATPNHMSWCIFVTSKHSSCSDLGICKLRTIDRRRPLLFREKLHCLTDRTSVAYNRAPEIRITWVSRSPLINLICWGVYVTSDYSPLHNRSMGTTES